MPLASASSYSLHKRLIIVVLERLRALQAIGPWAVQGVFG
jgi:hypothetical protein